MSSGAERFIEQLSKREMLPEAIINRLWDKVANSSSVPSARALATFLVDKGHLTREQADEAMAASKPKREPKPKKPKAKPTKAKASKSASDDPFDETSASKKVGAKDSGKKAGKKTYKKQTKGDNEFDTPLMLLGGGGLILGLLIIGGILWVLFRESGDDRFKEAQLAYEGGNYNQAIGEFEYFVEKFSNHERFSEARVQLGISKIRRAAESSAKKCLETAKEQIPLIEDEEEAFIAAQEDLASVLPEAAQQLSEIADAATELEAIEEYVGLTNEALKLCANTKYLPSRLRDEQKLRQIEEVLARIDLRKVALEQLKATIAEMRKAIDSGDTRIAYASHAAFTKAHPEKADDPELVEAVAATSQAEKDGIRFVEDSKQALTTEAKSPVTAQVATADRRSTTPAPANGISVIHYQGGAYAFNRRDGKLLWRRSVGASLKPAAPLLIDGDCLLVDSTNQELVRVNSQTGKLVWRAPLEDDVAQPVVSEGRVLLAGASGNLHIVDAGSGEVAGHVRFAQALQTAPVVYSAAKRIYLVGERSSLYTLDATTLECLGVFYLGHANGTVQSPPVMVLNRLIVAENDGASTSSLNVLGLDESGVVAKQLEYEGEAASRLNGLMTQPPEVFGKRFAVTTDSGYTSVFEASSESETSAITRLATRDNSRRVLSMPYTAVSNQMLWVAGTGLTRYSIQPGSNRLPAKEPEEPFRGDVFVHPLEVADGVVIHVRRRRGRAGATVAASDLKTGAVYWETDIAVPAAGAPVAAANNSLLYTTASGKVFVVDAAARNSGVAERSSSVTAPSNAAILDTGASLPAGGVYTSSATGAGLVISTDGDMAIEPLELPGGLAGAPMSFAKGWLAPLAIGQLFYFDGRTGQALAAPFQPEQSASASVAWRGAGSTTIDNAPAIVVGNGRSKLYTVALVESPTPHLAPLAERTLETTVVRSRVSVVGNHAVVALSDSRLHAFKADTLEPAGDSELTAEVTWGPYEAGKMTLLATADGNVHAFDPTNLKQPIWTQSSAITQLAGPPETTGDSVALAYIGGLLELRNLRTGKLTSQTQIGQAIASPPVRRGDELLVAAHDGSLLFVNPDQGE